MTTNVHNDRIDADAPSLNGSPNDAITTSTKTPPQVNAEPTGLRFEILELALMMTPATGDGGLRILELGTDAPPQPRRSLHSRIGRGGRLVSVHPSTEVTHAALQQSYARRLAYRTGPLAAGWPDHAPYDVIVCRQLVDHVPHAWLNQLAPRGRVLVPVRLTEPAQQIGLLCIDLDHEHLLRWPQHLLVANLTNSGLHQWRSAGALLTSTPDSYTIAATPTHNPRRPTGAFPETWIDDPRTARWLRTIDPTQPAHLAVTEHPTVGIPWHGLCGPAFNPAVEAPQHPRCPKCVKRLNRHLAIGPKQR